MNLPGANARSLTTPAIEFHYDGAAHLTGRPELSCEEASELGFMSGHHELAAVLRSSKKVHKSQEVDVIQALNRIVKHRDF